MEGGEKLEGGVVTFSSIEDNLLALLKFVLFRPLPQRGNLCGDLHRGLLRANEGT